jgi:hypothetical protein
VVPVLRLRTSKLSLHHQVSFGDATKEISFQELNWRMLRAV